jgi:hypothetical protein
MVCEFLVPTTTPPKFTGSGVISIEGAPAGAGLPMEIALLFVSAKVKFPIELKRNAKRVIRRMPDRSLCPKAVRISVALNRLQLQMFFISIEILELRLEGRLLDRGTHRGQTCATVHCTVYHCPNPALIDFSLRATGLPEARTVPLPLGEKPPHSKDKMKAGGDNCF